MPRSRWSSPASLLPSSPGQAGSGKRPHGQLTCLSAPCAEACGEDEASEGAVSGASGEGEQLSGDESRNESLSWVNTRRALPKRQLIKGRHVRGRAPPVRRSFPFGSRARFCCGASRVVVAVCGPVAGGHREPQEQRRRALLLRSLFVARRRANGALLKGRWQLVHGGCSNK